MLPWATDGRVRRRGILWQGDGQPWIQGVKHRGPVQSPRVKGMAKARRKSDRNKERPDLTCKVLCSISALFIENRYFRCNTHDTCKKLFSPEEFRETRHDMVMSTVFCCLRELGKHCW